MCLAIPGKIIHIKKTDSFLDKTGQVSFDGIIQEVNLAYIDDPKIGDYVIVHAGFALNKIDPIEAKKTIKDITKIIQG
jgi:hydrogenase expression/formation protein HypC